MVKVLVKSYRIPMVLLIMGPILLIASSLSAAERNLDLLKYTGLVFVLLGILAWLLSELSRIVRKSSIRKTQYTQPPQTPRRMRPY